MSLFRILETVTPRMMRSSTSIALLSGCGVRGSNTTVFHKAAGELIEGRVEFRARIIVYSSEMFQLAKPFARSQIVV